MAADIIIPTRVRLDWLKQVALSGVSHAASRIAVIISTHINSKTGSTYLGLELLAREGRMSRRTAWTAVGDLQRDGHLEVKQGGGRGKANVYRLILKTVQRAAPFNDPETVQSGAQTVQSGALNGAAGCTPTQSLTQYKNSTRPSRMADAHRHLDQLAQGRDDRTPKERRWSQAWDNVNRHLGIDQGVNRDQTDCYVVRACSADWYELLAWHEANGDHRSAQLMRDRAESGSGTWTAPPGWRPTGKIVSVRGRS